MKRCRGRSGGAGSLVFCLCVRLHLIDLGKRQVIFALATLGSMLTLFLHLSSDVDAGRSGAVIGSRQVPVSPLACLPELSPGACVLPGACVREAGVRPTGAGDRAGCGGRLPPRKWERSRPVRKEDAEFCLLLFTSLEKALPGDRGCRCSRTALSYGVPGSRSPSAGSPLAAGPASMQRRPACGQPSVPYPAQHRVCGVRVWSSGRLLEGCLLRSVYFSTFVFLGFPGWQAPS